MNQINITGGARIGMFNARWPLANLIVTKELLELNAPLMNLVFKTDDIVSIEPYTIASSMPSFGQGIKINHRIPNYKEKIIFWTQNPNELINQIKQTGFLDKSSIIDGSPEDEIIRQKQKQGAFPLKTPFSIALIITVAIWGILSLFDLFSAFSRKFEGTLIDDLFKFLNRYLDGTFISIGANLASGFLLLILILVLFSANFRKIALKEGREINDIKKNLYFIMSIIVFIRLFIFSL